MNEGNELPWEKVAREASKRSLWIYKPEYKRWYTPEDFLHTFGHVKNYDKGVLQQIANKKPDWSHQCGVQTD